MKMIKWLGGMALIGILATSCVGKKKFQEMESLKNKIQEMYDQEQQEKGELKAQLDDANRKLKECNENSKRLSGDSAKLAGQVVDLEHDLENTKADCETLRDNYRQLRSQSSKQLQKYLDSLETQSRHLRELQDGLKEREARLAEVEAGIRQRDSVMNALRQRISDALLGFRDQGLSMEVRDGKVYVSLSNKLLFQSGSTQIDKKGQEALKELARVLKEQENLTIMVEGHTDDVKVTNLQHIKDNWDLSVMRSTEVVRLLVANGVEPTRIIPSGRGEWLPKAAGTTAEVRAANRRTEIILSPKLDELYQLINSQGK